MLPAKNNSISEERARKTRSKLFFLMLQKSAFLAYTKEEKNYHMKVFSFLFH